MKYRQEIDGLRAIAVLSVIFFHAGFSWISGGFVGVDVFFVISGYLITNIITSELSEGSFRISGFYERRMRRILPALYLVVTISILVAWKLLLPTEMQKFAESVSAVSIFSSNFLFWRQNGYFDTAAELKPLLHTWSLAIEEQFYVFFPISVLVIWRKRRSLLVHALLLMAILSLTAAHWAAQVKPTANFFLLPTRAWELILGALGAIYVSKRSGGWPSPRFVGTGYVNDLASGIGALLVLYGMIFFDEKTPFPSFYAIIPTFGTLLILLFADNSTYVGRLLAQKLFVSIGLISYSAYLWHQPIFAFSRHFLVGNPSTEVMICLIIIILGLAGLSYRFVEQPFRKVGLVSTHAVYTFSILGALLLFFFGYAGHLSNGWTWRIDNQLQEIDKVKSTTSQYNNCHSGKVYIPPRESCVLGEKSNPRVALIGDSHALVLAQEVEKYLKPRNIGFRPMTFGGCPPVVGLYRVEEEKDLMCAKFNDDVFEYLRMTAEIDVVVLVARWPLYFEGDRFNNQEGGLERGGPARVDVLDRDKRQKNDEYDRKLRVAERYIAGIKNLLNLNKKVVLVYSIPEAGWSVPEYLLKVYRDRGSISSKDGSTSADVYDLRTARTHSIFDSIGEHPNLYRVRPARVFCRDIILDRCITNLDGIPLYFDDNHLSDVGAGLLIRKIFDKVIY